MKQYLIFLIDDSLLTLSLYTGPKLPAQTALKPITFMVDSERDIEFSHTHTSSFNSTFILVKYIYAFLRITIFVTYQI